MVSFPVRGFFFLLAVISAVSCSHPKRYPVHFDNCGPETCNPPTIFEPPVQTPTFEGPIITLPAPIPPTRTVSNRCVCIKKIVKPQVVKQLIVVPTIHRFIRTLHKPVTETVIYYVNPVDCPSCNNRPCFQN